MGEIAEMMLDGTLDSVTGEYLGEPCGYPRSITDGTFHQDRNKLQRKASQSIRDLCRNLLGVTDKNMIDQLVRSFLKIIGLARIPKKPAMGIRLHVAEVYQVKHHSRDYFNNHSADINRMLHKYCPNLSWEGEDVVCSSRLEVPRSELADLIGKIVNNREDFEKWLKIHMIDITVDKFIRYIAEWIAFSDQRNDFVVLTWY